MLVGGQQGVGKILITENILEVISQLLLNKLPC